MFIGQAKIQNYKAFKNSFELTSTHLGIPDGVNSGSGLTIIVGENGTGKTSILEALALPLLSYRAEQITLGDFSDIQQNIEVELTSHEPFKVKKTIRGDFDATGLRFTGKLRAQNSNRYMVGTAVTDTLYVPDPAAGMQDGSPDLRVGVENPFAGARFSDNEYLYIDKNRTKALESGTFSSTKFDRVLDNLSFQYLKSNSGATLDLNESLNTLLEASQIENSYLNEAFNDFKDATGYQVTIDLIDNTLPYKKAFLSTEDNGRKQIPVEKLGSGYQMFLALICHQKLSNQSGKKLIILIDEVELHLHPKLQKQLVKLLLELSKNAQIILTTHSPELLKDVQSNNNRKINALVRDDETFAINPIGEFVLPLPTISETNFVAFDLASMEYFIELYNHFGELHGVMMPSAVDPFLRAEGETLIDWERDDGQSQQLTKYSCIRNKFHHPTNTMNDAKFAFDYDSVHQATLELREKISTATTD